MYFIKQDNKIIPTKEGEKALQKLGMTFERFVSAVENNENPNSRWPANLLITDDALNDGTITKTIPHGGDDKPLDTREMGWGFKRMPSTLQDEGSKSRYFDIDVWAEKWGLLQYPKASTSERNEGCDGLELKRGGSMMANTGETMRLGRASLKGEPKEKQPTGNFHPTIKPVHLIAYLVRLISKEGDVVLDPFLGSGTTLMACKMLGRKGIGIEKEKDYCEIAVKRIDSIPNKLF